MNKTIAIIGSSRRNGNTGKLMDVIAKELAIEVVDLSDKNISPYDYQHKNNGDDFLSTMSHILKHDNIIFASPVYWYAMSAQMKIFFDRLSDLLSVEELKSMGRQLRGKVGYVVSTSVSDKVDDAYIDSFTNTFSYLGMDFGNVIHANCINGFTSDIYRNDIANFIKKLQ